MNEWIMKLKKWLYSRNSRERMFIFAGSFVILYFLWNVIFLRPIHQSEVSYLSETQKIQGELSVQQTQTNEILQIVTEPRFQQMLSEQKNLKSSGANIIQQLNSVKSTVIPIENYSAVVEAILNTTGNIKIINIKKLPPEPWIPKDLLTPDIPPELKNIYKYAIQIEILSNFFNAISYLENLEKLPWRIYWDTLDYKVTKYPEADITITFHVLITEKNTV